MTVSAPMKLLAYASMLGTSWATLQARQTELFDWSSVKPTTDLQYHDCYQAFKCARLAVPLDWTQCSDGSSSCGNCTNWAAIAIVTLPASVPEDDPSFGGTVLVNPGGPGGSGTELVVAEGAYIQEILDGDKHYEILGFDPRGVSLSTPSADCYEDDFLRGNDAVSKGGLPAGPPGSPGLTMSYEMAKGVAGLCGQLGPKSIFAHMSTASVARDMLEIVDRVDAVRKGGSNATSTRDEEELPRLQYLGFSYGTFLGNTFASMFPGRVGRMVLDGVVDPYNYLEDSMSITLKDAETVIGAFYQTCFDAGDACGMRQASDSSADDIRERMNDMIAYLEENPQAVLFNGRVRLVTSFTVKDVMRQMLYSQLAGYEPTSMAFAEALAGNYSLLLQTNTGLATSVAPEEVCVNPGVTYPPSAYSMATNEAGYGVFCGDAYVDPEERGLEWANRVLEGFDEQSPTVGESWARNILACAGWQYEPKLAFRGPFGSPKPDGSAEAPAAPLLLLSNRHDHATPLSSAYIVSGQHEGSAVVVQETFGHCALLASRSACTQAIVSTYFATGEVPANNTVCEQDCVPSIPFKSCPGLTA